MIEPGFPLGEGGKAEKIRLNLRAIEILKELQRQDRIPIVGERKELARYTGWGGLKDILKNRAPKGPDEEYSSENRAHFRLKELVRDKEFTRILLSARNAHYTSRDVVETMFKGLRKLGVHGGTAPPPRGKDSTSRDTASSGDHRAIFTGFVAPIIFTLA